MQEDFQPMGLRLAGDADNAEMDKKMIFDEMLEPIRSIRFAV
jgi:hypothetical protein